MIFAKNTSAKDAFNSNAQSLAKAAAKKKIEKKDDRRTRSADEKENGPPRLAEKKDDSREEDSPDRLDEKNDDSRETNSQHQLAEEKREEPKISFSNIASAEQKGVEKKREEPKLTDNFRCVFPKKCILRGSFTSYIYPMFRNKYQRYLPIDFQLLRRNTPLLIDREITYAAE